MCTFLTPTTHHVIAVVAVAVASGTTTRLIDLSLQSEDELEKIYDQGTDEHISALFPEQGGGLLRSWDAPWKNYYESDEQGFVRHKGYKETLSKEDKPAIQATWTREFQTTFQCNGWGLVDTHNGVLNTTQDSLMV
jgi:hypothetical protein